MPSTVYIYIFYFSPYIVVERFCFATVIAGVPPFRGGTVQVPEYTGQYIIRYNVKYGGYCVYTFILIYK